jgi:hypothetical protein
MSQAQTAITGSGVEAFIETVEPMARLDEARALDALFRHVSVEMPKIWGAAIIDYGEYRTTDESGPTWILGAAASVRKRPSTHFICKADIATI